MKQDLHIHNAVIETTTKEQKGTEIKVLGSTFITFEDIDGIEQADKAIIVPTKVESLELNQPKSSFTTSLQTGTAADEAYNVKQSMKYNTSTGVLAEIMKPSDISITYLLVFHSY